MDKRTVIGLVLIGLILLGYSIINKPSKEQLAEQQRFRDSIRQVQINDSIEQAALAALNINDENIQDTSINETLEIESEINDSIKAVALAEKYGAFVDVAEGENEFYTVENEEMIIVFSTKGGRIYSLELKNYKTHDSLPLILFSGDTTMFGLDLMIGGTAVFTDDLYFEPIGFDQKVDATKEEQEVAMRLNAGDDQYVEFRYTIKPDEFMIDFNLIFHNMESILSQNISFYKMRWSVNTKAFERGRKWEYTNTNIYLKMDDNAIEKLNPQKDRDEFK
ncbi:MAG: YidC/Oxa1 family membrane protein insertase, partial [Bacteroidales bacterium]|nr:YidC/Oxa1 family membrane protein insertase [Bacteroidales bacterium]